MQGEHWRVLSSVFLWDILRASERYRWFPSHNSRVRLGQRRLQNAAEHMEDGQSFSDTFPLIHEPQTDHRTYLIWVIHCCERSHCCTCKSELKTGSFSSSVWCRVPGGSPGRAWRSSGTISQWTPQLKDPQWSHTTPGTGVPCFAGWALPPLSAKRLDQSLPWRPWQTPGPWQGLCSETGQGRWLALGSLFWGASGSLHFIP